MLGIILFSRKSSPRMLGIKGFRCSETPLAAAVPAEAAEAAAAAAAAVAVHLYSFLLIVGTINSWLRQASRSE